MNNWRGADRFDVKKITHNRKADQHDISDIDSDIDIDNRQVKKLIRLENTIEE